MEFDWLEFLFKIFDVCLIPLLGILTAYLVKWLKAKELEVNAKLDSEIAEKYVSLVAATITDCVIATNQTYVEALKAQGSFDENAQKIAFNKTLEAVLTILSDDAKDYLTNIYGDLMQYLTMRIEAEVNAQK